MAWAALIPVAISLAQSVMGGAANKSAAKAQAIIDKANAQAQNILGQANADANNRLRKGSNAFAVAQASLSNFTQSLGNQDRLREGGEAINALNTNLVRLQDQAVTGSLNQRITAAEQLGAVRAAMAASGAGGTSSAMLHQTMQLAQARQATTNDQNMKYQTYDMLAQRAGLVSNMVMSVDQGQTFAPVDYGVDTAPLIQPPFRAEAHTSYNILSYIDPALADVVGAAIGKGGSWLNQFLGAGGSAAAASSIIPAVQGFTSGGRSTPAPITDMSR